MNHLTLPAYCLLIAACSVALLVRSIWTHADSLVLLSLLAFLFFAWRAVVETRRSWPAFRADCRRRAEARRRAAQQRRYPSSDIH